MKSTNVIVLSYVPTYNRQGADLARALRSSEANVHLYQLDGPTDPIQKVYGVKSIKPHGVFSKFHVLWNMLHFVFPTVFKRKDVVVCVGRPVLLVGAIYRFLFGCKFVYYALEYSDLGRLDHWAIRRVDRYIDVEENRCQHVVQKNKLSMPTLVIHNMPPLRKRPKGGALRSFLGRTYGISPRARLVIYAGSYQWYACLPQIIEASSHLPDDEYLVLMTYNLPDELRAKMSSKCLVIPPISGVAFYDWLADADCALLPYEDERDYNVRNCSPQKLFDCYLAGTPYIASDRPIIRQTLAHLPEAGRLCNFTDMDGVRDCLMRVESKKDNVCEKMYGLHCARFNYDSMAETIAQLILT